MVIYVRYCSRDGAARVRGGVLINRIVRASVAIFGVAAPFYGAFGAIGDNHIKHVIMIMQENRSFDQYFGTYPGANGFPNGTCVPLNPGQPQLGCVAPFHDQHDVNAGGPHGAPSAQVEMDYSGSGIPLMDGFVYQQTVVGTKSCSTTLPPDAPTKNCNGLVPGVARHDVMGYHNADEIPNYWAYAQHFVLQDQLYESVRGWSGASHLDLTSEWAAICSNPAVLSSCVSNPNGGHRAGTAVAFPGSICSS